MADFGDFGLSAGIQNAGQLGNGLIFADMNSDEADSARGYGYSQQQSAEMFSARQQQNAQDFQERMRSTAWQTTVADMKAAGINPMLAVAHGAPNATPGAGIAGGTTAGGGPMAHNAAPAFDYFGASAAALNTANADKARAEAKEIEARTQTYPVQIDKLRQDIKQSQATVEQLSATTTREYASAGQADAHAAQLRAQIPVLDATVKQIVALGKLNEAQALQALATAGLHGEEANRIFKQVQAGTPELEAKWLAAKTALEQGNIAQSEAKQSVYTTANSNLGKFAEFIRAFNPLAGILK